VPSSHEKGHKIRLIFIINGQDFAVEANIDAPIMVAVKRALVESGNQGRPAEEWELRNVAGVLLDKSKTPLELGLVNEARLFLSLRVGAGGH
jgi:hypothetical protein